MDSWRKHILESDLDKPSSQQRTVEIKAMTVGDSLRLGGHDGTLIEYLQALCDDPTHKKHIADLRPEVLRTFAQLCMGSRNYIGFNGCPDPQKPLDTLLSSPPAIQGVYPLWSGEVLAEIGREQTAHEDEEKNL